MKTTAIESVHVFNYLNMCNRLSNLTAHIQVFWVIWKSKYALVFKWIDHGIERVLNMSATNYDNVYIKPQFFNTNSVVSPTELQKKTTEIKHYLSFIQKSWHLRRTIQKNKNKNMFKDIDESQQSKHGKGWCWGFTSLWAWFKLITTVLHRKRRRRTKHFISCIRRWE